MQPDEIKKWLTSEEIGLHENADDFIASAGDDDWEASNHYSRVKDALESLAATRERSEQCRVLLKKHQYNKSGYCRECAMLKGHDCYADCARDAALKDVGE